MHTTVLTESLRDALNITRPAVASRTALPVLSCILLETRDTSLHIAATDREVGIATDITADTTDHGAIAVDAALLRDFVVTLSGERVQLDLDSDHARYRLTVTCGGDTAKISGISAEDFPVLPTFSDDLRHVTFPAGGVQDATRLMPFAVATEASRPILTGVGLTVKDGRAVWGASDGFRMSVLEQDAETDAEFVAIIPANALRALEPIVAKTEEAITLAMRANASQLLARIGDTEWVSRLIEGTFPNVIQVVPREFLSSVSLSADLAAKALRRANVFARTNGERRGKVVHFDLVAGEDDLTPATITIDAATDERGSMRSVLPGAMTGPDLQFKLDGGYVVEYLSAAAKSGNVTMAGNESNQAVLLTSQQNGFRHVIMPMVIGS